jgi:hypothetical protein
MNRTAFTIKQYANIQISFHKNIWVNNELIKIIGSWVLLFFFIYHHGELLENVSVGSWGLVRE